MKKKRGEFLQAVVRVVVGIAAILYIPVILVVLVYYPEG